MPGAVFFLLRKCDYLVWEKRRDLGVTVKGADRKLGLVPGEPLALGEGARAFCPLLLSPSP